MKKYEIHGHEPGFLPDGEWKLVWRDEFVVDYVRIFDEEEEA